MTKKIRIRHAKGSSTINSAATAKEIGEQIQEITGISIRSQEWKYGYPPRPVLLGANEPLPVEVDSILVSEGGQPSLKFDAVNSGMTPEDAFPFDLGLLHEEPPMVDPEGLVVRRVVQADDSCLFHSVGYAFQQSPAMSSALRSAVAQTVLADPTTYSDSFLGRPTAEYGSWIQEPTSWGGQIELSILSQVLQTEIAVLDIIRNRYDVYGTDAGYKRRIYVIYDGIHYDALAYCFDPQLPPDMDTRIFSPKDIIVLERAMIFCSQEHQQKSFTDTSNFTLRCLVCQVGLKAQTEAAEHAKQTGHANFAEFHDKGA